MLCIFLAFIAVFIVPVLRQPLICKPPIQVRLDGALCSVFSRAHQGSTGGLLQRFSVGLAADASFLSHLRVDSWFICFL